MYMNLQCWWHKSDWLNMHLIKTNLLFESNKYHVKKVNKKHTAQRRKIKTNKKRPKIRGNHLFNQKIKKNNLEGWF